MKIRRGISSCILLIGIWGFAARCEENLLPPAGEGLITYAETLGPAEPGAGTFEKGEGAGSPVLLSYAGIDGPPWKENSEWYFDLSRRFLPVSGVLRLRTRIRAAEPGERSLRVYSYNRTADVHVVQGEKVLYTGPPPDKGMSRIPLKVEGEGDVVITLRITPRYSHSYVTLLWEQGPGDRVVVSDGAGIEQALLEAIRPRFVPSSPEPGETVGVNVTPRDVPQGFEPPPLEITPPGEAAERLRLNDIISFRLPDEAPGSSWKFVLSSGDSRREVHLPCPAGIRKEYERLQSVADDIPLGDRPNYPVFLLRVAQMEEMLSLRTSPAVWTKALEWVDEASEAFAVEDGGGDFYGRRPGFREDGYVSRVDMSAQPYHLYVPSGLNGPAPLVVYLHGYVPDYTRSNWLRPNPMELALYEERGALFVVPFARSNTDFLTVGEKDVLDVIDEVERRFEIDRGRIHVVGYSMGGSGAWTLMSHYPDLFASALILAGRTDYYLWRDLDPAELAPWLNFMIRTDNPLDHAHNLSRIPITVLHGDADWVVKKEHSTRMVEKLKALGSPVKMYWLRGADHWRAGPALYDEQMIDTLLSDIRKPAAVQTGCYCVHTPRYGRAGGIEVRFLLDWMKPGNLVFSRSEDGLRVDCTGVGALSVPGGPEDLSTPGFVRAGGNCRVMHGLFPERCSPYPAKTPGLSGPFKDVVCGPFAIIYGTGGDEPAELKAAAEEWAGTWFDFAKGKALVYPDSDAPGEILKHRNLILIGGPQENSVAARIIPHVPFDIKNGAVMMRTPEGRELSLGGGGEGEGYLITYPNPFTGLYAAFTGVEVWGRDLPINHKWDFVPDIVVFRRGKQGFQNSDEYLWAGFFDTFWRVEETLLFEGHLAEPRM